MRVFVARFAPFYMDGNCFALRIHEAPSRCAGNPWPAWIGFRRGIRMPNVMIDVLLLMIIIAGIGLSVAYLRAEYVLHRGIKIRVAYMRENPNQT
jgi:hypothetical protein